MPVSRNRIVEYVEGTNPDGSEVVYPAIVVQVHYKEGSTEADTVGLFVFTMVGSSIEDNVLAEGTLVDNPRPADLPEDAVWNESQRPATRYWRWPRRS